MTSPLKIGLMGYGFAGQTFHAPVIAHCGHAVVAAIATGQPDRARADYPDATLVADLDALVALTDVECVVIATPNDTHFDLARRTLASGKHVVVDKPVTLTAAEARTLADLAQQRGLVFAPFHNRRWDGDFATVRELLDAGTLGRVTHFESHFDRFRPLVRQRWREDAARGGGLLYDLGPHLIDQALALFGAPDTVTAFVHTRRDDGSAPDYAHLVLGYPQHEAVLHASALAAFAPRFVIHGTRGSYLKNGLDTQEDQLKAGLRPGDAGFGGGNEPGRLHVLLDDGHETERTLPTADGDYTGFYRALAASIRAGVPFPVSPQDAIDVMTVIELAMQSAASGRTLAFAHAS
ncbi:oxidoreductase [Paraburkholderia caballeronis]|uniref:Predicted dehydrogenase n=1 Tax=Paraburkholderia caballeronis TaxID=416943 RepID=A0A1H7GWH9_9BURK|nr:oxidoreductase [Paraburkholderia caballeronis]PXW29742.1 putative dehydrogenase [Paraburkholderia caballeronis]PXX05001.1 putative dehydrogenase [Paraburkholderia caballeronis]RAK06062.1 putative dehydrogenase [Paraburkholderia caballeronis]TDV37453.1 putative dehydrogenase [Paraburkholderia caballeronis]SEB47769.1 Predicted dehydrogenase [Paraburkholderia caballeronis]